MSETTKIESAIWPTYALRAWVGALLAQTRRAREDLEARIEAAEKEVARLRRQHERADTVIESLQGTIEQVDARLSRIRDINLTASAEKHDEAHDRQAGQEATERDGPKGTPAGGKRKR
jgi:chromosome segregation ATPase